MARAGRLEPHRARLGGRVQVVTVPLTMAGHPRSPMVRSAPSPELSQLSASGGAAARILAPRASAPPDRGAKPPLTGERPHGCHTHFAWDTALVSAYLSRLLEVPASVTLHANDIYVADPARLRARLAYFDQLATVCNFNVGLLTGLGMAKGPGSGIDRHRSLRCCRPRGVGTAAALNSASTWLRLGGSSRRRASIRSFAQSRWSRNRLPPEVRASIAGEGPERAALTRLIAELDLEENVTLTGAMNHKDTLELIAGARVFCLASQAAREGDSDAVPVVIREAMARGVPVISTRVAGIPETVDDEVGWLVDPRVARTTRRCDHRGAER